MNKTQNKSLSINQIPPLIRRKICKKLDVKQKLGGDFRTLAAMVGMSNEDIQLTSQSNEPTEDVLNWWGKKKEATVPNLRQILEKMERDDVIQILDDNNTEAVLQLSTDQVDASSKDAPKATATNNAVEGDTSAVLHLSTDQVDASSKDAPKATATNNSVEGDTTAPPDVDLIRKGDVCAREDDWDEKPVDVVLLTVNGFEFLAAYEILSEPSTAVVKDLGSVYFGDVGETKVALLQSEMGANNHAASAEKGLKAKDYLHPNVIITLGVCFGLKEDKHKLGDLLISKSVTRYAQVRKNSDGKKVLRSDTFPVDATIFSLFKHGELGWSSPQSSKYQVNVYTGEILSGPELIDHKETREELKRSFPQALGGEMEAEGLMRLGVPCIVCKSIVDWADGKKKKDWQKFGAKVSASYVAQVLKSRKFTNAYKNRIDTGDEVDAGANRAKRRRAEDENETSKESTKAKRPKKLRIDQINGRLYQKLCTELRKENEGKDYIALAGVMGYNKGQIESFQLRHDPADALLTNWGVESGNDVSRLYEHLRKIGRKDLVDMLEE